MKKLTFSIFTLLLALLLALSAFSAVGSYDGVTNAKTPTAKTTAKYIKKLGEGYAFAPTAPVWNDGELIVLSGRKLYKLNAKTGKEIASAATIDSNQYTVSRPCVGGGMIFVPLNGGKIQAFDYKTLKSLWVYTDSIGGQSLTNIVYESGFIYTGFWNGDTANANYVCITTKDENTAKTNEAKSAKWVYTSKGGFYLNDACLTSKFVIIGGDNGVKDDTSNASVVSLNKSTGKKVSSISLKGDLRSAVVYDNASKRYFISSKAGFLYSFAVNVSTGAISGKKQLALSGASTASPVIYNGRLYIGCADGTLGRQCVIDPVKMKMIYYVKTNGYPQAPVLISKGYENSGKIYVYYTVNAKPGALFAFEDSENASKSTAFEVYTPTDSYSQYCISTVAASGDGMLFYKNDSGAIFALNQKAPTGIIKIINTILQLFNRLLGRA